MKHILLTILLISATCIASFALKTNQLNGCWKIEAINCKAYIYNRNSKTPFTFFDNHGKVMGKDSLDNEGQEMFKAFTSLTIIISKGNVTFQTTVPKENTNTGLEIKVKGNTIKLIPLEYNKKMPAKAIKGTIQKAGKNFVMEAAEKNEPANKVKVIISPCG